jgi:dTDP-4-amino-4,6-dideoxygalactose transaminase
VYHLFVIRAKNRDGLMEHLKEHGVDTGLHYPTPLHLTPAYAYRKYRKGDFPVAEKCCSEILSIPMHPEMTEDQICYVADTIKQFYAL